MQSSLTVASVQFNLSLGNVDTNLTCALDGIRQAAAKGA